MTELDWDALIRPEAVHRCVHVSPDIFELELERIWGHAWIYVGHASQAKKPGDYFATQIGKVPVILVRDKDGALTVLNNRCAHKGVKLVPEGCGSVAGRFRCPYHGWTFKLDGTLASVPSPRHYHGTGFDIADPKFHLARLPAVASYRGFVFARLCADGPDLEAFLGDSARTLDNLVERSPAGEIEVVGPPLRYLHDCNWKMWLENLNDALHPMVTHGSVVDVVRKMQRDAGEGQPSHAAEILAPAGASYEVFDAFGVTVMPHGHSYMGGSRSVHSSYGEIPGYFAAMKTAWGEAKTQEILGQNRHNTVIYPSLTAKDAVQVIRVVKPLSFDKTIVETWHFRLLGAPDELLQRTLLYSRLVNSSASLVGPDDWEVYTRMQEALASGPNDWIDMRRGLQPGQEDGGTSFGTSDLVFRNQYKAWKRYMANGRTAA